MVEDQISYIVTWPEETRGLSDGPSSPIPSIGAATSTIDQYRIVGIHHSNLAEKGGAFTDVGAAAALARIAEGGISTHEDLQAAETALQAILLHERVHVLTYAPKVIHAPGFISYSRQDIGRRSDLAFQLFQIAGSEDIIIAPELVNIDDGRVVSSTSGRSPLIGSTVDQLTQGRPYWSEDVEDAINVAIEMHGVPAYLTEPQLVRARAGDGFAKQFYRRMRQPWDEAVGNSPPIVCTFSLPPLLAIVLNRLNNRADLLPVLLDLRAELSSVRNELTEFNKLVVVSTTQVEVEARQRQINESFDAIVADSRLTTVQRRRRNLISIYKLGRPLIKVATCLWMKSGGSFEQARNAAGGIASLVGQLYT